MPCAARLIRRVKDARGWNYVVEFPEKVRFPGEDQPKGSVWFNVNKETTEGEAEDSAWEYFVEVQRRLAR